MATMDFLRETRTCQNVTLCEKRKRMILILETLIYLQPRED